MSVLYPPVVVDRDGLAWIWSNHMECYLAPGHMGHGYETLKRERGPLTAPDPASQPAAPFLLPVMPKGMQAALAADGYATLTRLLAEEEAASFSHMMRGGSGTTVADQQLNALFETVEELFGEEPEVCENCGCFETEDGAASWVDGLCPVCELLR